MIIEIPGVGTVEFPDDMPMEQVSAALEQYRTKPAGPPQAQVNADGTYGQAPEGFVQNPKTGQMEDLRSPINPNIPFVGIPESRSSVETTTDSQGRGIHNVVHRQQSGGGAGAFAMGAGQGLGFGGFDESVAGLSSMLGGDYGYDLARMREVDRRSQEYHPGAYYSGLVPGAVASSVTAGKALGVNPTGRGLMDTALRGGAIGGGEGTIWGFLTGEGGAGSRAKSAAKTGAIGTAIGGASPFVVAAGARGARAIGDLVGGGVDAVLGRVSGGRANRSVMDMLRKAGLSVDDVADDVARAARAGQPEYRVMDAAGRVGQRKASGIVRSGGEGAEEIAKFLETRQLGQPERVGSFVDDAFGMRGTTAAQTVDNMKAARGAAADSAYAAARGNAAPVDVRGAIAAIDDRIGGMRGGNVVGDGVDATLARFRARLAAPTAPSGEISRELSDFNRVLGVKQDIQDAIGGAVRAGRNNEARELGRLVNELDAALEAASDGYRAANDGFREASRVIGAVDDGAMMARPSARPGDTVPRYKAMTPEQQAAARIGYGDKALARVEANAAPTANRARPFGSPKVSQEIDAMAIDPRLFKDRLGRETAMWETQNRALQGSRTADNLQDIGDVGLLSDFGRAVKTALTSPLQALGSVAAKAGPIASGQNEATRALIAKMLMSDNPKQALTQALRQETTSQGRKRIAEAFARALGREAIPTP